MRKAILIGAAAFLITACNNENHGEHSVTAPKAEAKKFQFDVANLFSKTDPICEMELDNEIIADTALVEGKIYGFCHTGCKEEFLKQQANTK